MMTRFPKDLFAYLILYAFKIREFNKFIQLKANMASIKYYQ